MRGTSTIRRGRSVGWGEAQGAEGGGRERRERTVGVKTVRAALTQVPAGRLTSVSKAGIGIDPGRRRRREACW